MAHEHDSEARPPSSRRTSASDASASPSGRPKRSSVRPSAFGPPRGATTGERAEGEESPQASEAELAADAQPSSPAEPDPYELTPSSTPSALEFVSSDLFPDEPSPDSSDAWTPLGARQNVFPTLGYDPFRGPDSQPVPDDDSDSEEVSVPGFEETEVTSPSLVAARSGLLPIPESPPGSSEESGADSPVGPLSIALFVLMLLAAGGVLVAQWPQDSGRAVQGAPAQRPGGAKPVPDRPLEPASPPPARGRRTPPPLAAEPPEAILAKVEPRLPEQPEAAAERLLAYARSYLEEARPEVADLLLARALELDPTHEGVLLSLGERALSAGQLEQAEAHARAAVEVDPQSAGPQLLLGDVFAERGQRSRAQRHYRRAVQLEPDSAAARSRLEDQ